MKELITNLTWAIVPLSLLGGVLNAKAKIQGYYVWIVANLLWVAFDIYIDNYAQAALMLTYTGISAFGIYSWRKQKINTRK
jgi:nicotinamide riboside transporter PnuC